LTCNTIINSEPLNCLCVTYQELVSGSMVFVNSFVINWSTSQICYSKFCTLSVVQNILLQQMIPCC